MSLFLRQRLARVALLGLALASGCGSDANGGGQFHGSINLIDRTTQSLAQSGSPVAVKGSYGPGCAYRSTSGTWSLPIGGYSGVSEGASPVVRQGNTSCTLIITELTTAAASEQVGAIAPPIVLSQTYLDSASTCSYPGTTPPSYVDARLRSSDGALFTSDFIIDLVYSNDPVRVDQVVQTQYATVKATVQVAGVPVSDYAADVAGFSLAVDAHGALTQLGGQILLQPGNQPAQAYVLTTSDPGSTADSINALYEAGTPIAVAGAPIALPASAFALSTLPVTRYLILANYLATAPAVRSYQVFAFHFVVP